MAISDADLAAKRGLNVELIETLRQTRGTSNESLEGAPEGALRRAIRRLSVPDAPRARLQQQLRKSRGDDGRVPSNAIGRALQQTRILGKRAAAAPRVAGLPVRGALTPLALEGAAGPRPTAAGLSTKRWQWLGPGNIGGRTRAIVIHPTDTQRMRPPAPRAECGSPRTAAPVGPGGRLHGQPRRELHRDRPKRPEHDLCRHRRGLLQRRRAARWRHLPDVGGDLAAHRRDDGDFRAVNRLAVSANGKSCSRRPPSGIFRSADAARAIWTTVLPSGVADVKFHPTRLRTRASPAA